MEYIRDLVGIKTIENKSIKKNVLIRSSQLYKPNTSQINYLNSIGLKRVIDLRNEKEAFEEPDIKIEGAKYYNFSLIDADLNGITHESRSNQLVMLKEMETIEETYRKFADDDYSSNAIKEAIREIVLNHEYPTIIHCVTGKDRAGIIVFILLRILGVDYNTALDDYLKQHKIYVNYARYLYVIAFIFSGFNHNLGKKAYDYYDVNKKFIDATLNAIDKKYGNFDSYIKDYIGLSDKDIEEFKNQILE